MEAHTSRSFRPHQIYRIKCDTADLEKSEGKQSKALQDDQVDVEKNQVFERACQDICNACCVLEGIPNLIKIPCSIGSCPEHSEDDEQVEEREKEILGY